MDSIEFSQWLVPALVGAALLFRVHQLLWGSIAKIMRHAPGHTGLRLNAFQSWGEAAAKQSASTSRPSTNRHHRLMVRLLAREIADHRSTLEAVDSEIARELGKINERNRRLPHRSRGT
jgi:hypothetical protein